MSRKARLTGFTLFRKDENRWQMSVRREDEAGWSVTFIFKEQADAVLGMLEVSGHPDGPWQIRKPRLQKAFTRLTKLVEARGELEG